MLWRHSATGLRLFIDHEESLVRHGFQKNWYWPEAGAVMKEAWSAR